MEFLFPIKSDFENNYGSLAISTLPLISVYIASGGQTEVILPNFLRGYEIELPFIGSILSAGGILKLGPLYYLYLFALIIFCLNSINILAGVNGLEGMSKLSLQYCI